MADIILDWLEEPVKWVLILLMVGTPFIIIAMLMGSSGPEFSLKKSDWVCTHYHEYTTTNMIMSGNIMVPVTQFNKECVQWNHK